MSNMGYCRFQNTMKDLEDCWDNWDDELSPNEEKARKRMKELACEIAESEGWTNE